MYKCLNCGHKTASLRECAQCGSVDHLDRDTDEPLPPTVTTEVKGVKVDYDDPPLRRRQLSK